METAKLKKFAQFARLSLIEQVSAKIKLVLAEGSGARRESVEAIKQLDEAIKKVGKSQVVERVAYIWFNRFCALRFMDVNRYTRIGVVSPAEGQFQPEILAEAKMGHIDEDMVNDKIRQQIFALLGGTVPSRDPQGEAYRLLVVGVCNRWHRAMPFLFERIDDYTELLMPDDLLSGNSILAYTREAMTPDACKDVEVIGWLYQFYISEKKDQVFDGLKKNKKITPENIPAATQLFTPHWIVKYLVENSLGRLWMLNRPNSRLIDRMEYYIRPDTSGVRDQGLGVRQKTGGNYGSEKLSGPNRLAEGDGSSGTGLQSDTSISQGGALWPDQSGSQGSSVDSIQHSGGALSQLDSGVQELPFNSSGLQSGSGNANSDRSTAELHIAATSAGNTFFAEGNLENPGSVEKETNPRPLTPNPSASTPEKAETDFLKVGSPEEIRICDPACGSGHMLTYAFDLLHVIYEEEGYEPAEIPEKILTHNLYGIEIDERAGVLAAFALTMKARAKQRRFFNKGVKLNICVLENVHFDESELKNYMDFVGRDLFTAPLQTTLRQFEEADNFGSLIRPDVTNVDDMLRILESKNVSGQLFLSRTHQKVLKVLQQADYLSPKYHVVVANPPYMGGKGMNARLTAFIKVNFPDSNTDLFSCFVDRCFLISAPNASLGFMTPFTWMFLSSFEKLRQKMLTETHIASLVRPEYHSFYESAHVPICAFVLRKEPDEDRLGDFFDLNEFRGAELQPKLLKEGLSDPNCRYRYRANSSDFRALPGAPIAYLLSKRVIETYKSSGTLKDHYPPKQGVKTGNNDRFLRFWQEVEKSKSALSKSVPVETGVRWFPCSKGGDFRRWYGNHEYLIDWENDGQRIKNYRSDDGKLLSRPQNIQYFFVGGLTWSTLTIKSISMRLLPDHFAFESKGSAIPIPDQKNLLRLLAYLNSSVVETLIGATSPTMDYGEGAVGRLPYMPNVTGTQNLAEQATQISRADWDAAEVSWDFTSLPLLQSDYRQPTLQATYQNLRARWQKMTLEMQRLEEENNRIFIDAYCLQDELMPEVLLNEITLTCNPHYRYSNDKNEDELEALLLADTMRELVSYAVGCMFGRYALDKPGLILANQGESIEDYLKRVPEPSFSADDDNVIPMLDGDWFTDDIAERFRKFLRVAFGEEHYEENLKFIETALGKNGNLRDIRNYFLKDFYDDHVKRYKKRPIYWLFSSSKGTFNALIYMHRYRPDTASVVLNDYLREFRTKLSSHKNHLEAVSISAGSTQSEKTKALKEIEKVSKMITEVEEYEREVLYPLATEQVKIELDNGVKNNYPLFGAALKKIAGLSD